MGKEEGEKERIRGSEIDRQTVKKAQSPIERDRKKTERHTQGELKAARERWRNT